MCLDKKMMKNESSLQSENGVVLSRTPQSRGLHMKRFGHSELAVG